jgi:hypothetical protein
MGRADARSAEIDRPDRVFRILQVNCHNVEPSKAVRACNLLPKHNWRAALFDETKKGRPKVSFVSGAAALARAAERLARAGACPDSLGVRDAGAPEGVAPDADAGEEVALNIPPKVICGDVSDISFIDLSWRDVARCNQVAQPLRRIGFVFVVIGELHGAISSSLVTPRISKRRMPWLKAASYIRGTPISS